MRQAKRPETKRGGVRIMSNFKRKKTKRRVRCTLCTPVKWLGNNKGRKPAEVAANRDGQKMKKAINTEIEGDQP